MTSDHSKILDKIKKCLALSASCNEHEAEAALRQARKLMEAHGLTETHLQATGADERRAKAGVRSRPSRWETMLAQNIGDAFNCVVIFSGSGWAVSGEWCFIGCQAAPEVAGYAFAVLSSQAKRARANHIRERLGRCKGATKTRRADLFSEGWVRVVAGAIAAFSCTAEQSAAIGAYLEVHYPTLKNLQPRDRNGGRRLRDHEYGDYVAGRLSGQDAKLHRGISAGAQPLALESAQ
ncbi:DUF2786 domain-containing protein [Pandoraea norimbergensis]|uniref:DUF2786 domain-containing protein n=1 Tax=Pandoraea norimbergensis TaxID=93219 RepID=A0ABN4JI81_9BURK|nr:DUF2786 domain-containing protein [Pandoraea norimbergensis]ALS60702.1 hypothetical protein AT302_13880 [Pandoraea norimbergensis]ALS61957.1 hypothetical protein AT302_21425 [Pandoraea norimbergensis]